ncbi:hypothetical protein GCM10023323_23630 [Streptomyces thinghirensis]|uniref:FHA domain-containing protein n=1 Tax=Streptomyces thinghirensis TaxID=551547 RepID=A0ABP9T404_9ACTN
MPCALPVWPGGAATRRTAFHRAPIQVGGPAWVGIRDGAGAQVEVKGAARHHVLLGDVCDTRYAEVGGPVALRRTGGQGQRADQQPAEVLVCGDAVRQVRHQHLLQSAPFVELRIARSRGHSLA